MQSADAPTSVCVSSAAFTKAMSKSLESISNRPVATEDQTKVEYTMVCVGCVSVVKADAVWKRITKMVPTVVNAQSSAMKLWLVLRYYCVMVTKAVNSQAELLQGFDSRTELVQI